MKRLILIAFGLFTYFGSQACDLCGCYLGVLPNYDANYFGARMRFRGFSGDMPHFHGINGQEPPVADTNTHSHDHFTTYELTGRYFITNRLSITGFLPYSVNSSSEGDEANTIAGLGDPSLLLQYRIFRRESQSDSSWQQNLSIGGGVKLPLGAYDKLYEDGDYEPHMQPGTGSWDALFTANYLARYNKVGLNADAVYRLNTTNKLGYKYGDRLNGSLHVIYWTELKNIKLLPEVGCYAEYAPADKLNDEAVGSTGGVSLFASQGLDIFYKDFSVNCTVQEPLIENLKGRQLANSVRVMSGLSWYF